jgi:uncharacterized protein YndB with AHSA1/START domain
MLVRQIVVPTTADQLWDALTAPDRVEAWFGSQVEWDLRPGGRARFVEGDGTIRGGEIDAVQPGRHFRFRWWPAGRRDGDDGEPIGASQVSYDLEPDGDGTRLTVTEELVPGGAPPPSASATTSPGSWTAWDSRLFRCWAAASGRALAQLAC